MTPKPKTTGDDRTTVTAPQPVTVKIIFGLAGRTGTWTIGATDRDGEQEIRAHLKRYAPNAKYIRHEVIT